MRLCICGFANDDSRQTCLACGNALPTAEVEERAGSVGSFRESGLSAACGLNGAEESCGAEEPLRKQVGGRALGLVDLRTNALVAVPAPGGVLGRAGDFEPDAFSPRVSGVHAVLACDDEGRWTIEHMGRNGSSVERGGSWVPLRTGQPQPLFGGELLKLADMVFRVSVADGAAEEEDEAATSENAVKAATMWSVRCPVCGTEHPVDGPQDRVAQCAFCQDPFDKVRIARVIPRQVPMSAQDV